MTNEMNSTQRKWKVNISVGDSVSKVSKKIKSSNKKFQKFLLQKFNSSGKVSVTSSAPSHN